MLRCPPKRAHAKIQAIEVRKNAIIELIKGVIKVGGAMAKLSCSRCAVERYRQRFYLRGPEGLDDRRRSNYRKIVKGIEARIVS